MNFYQIQAKINELSAQRKRASDILGCVVNSHMYSFVAEKSSMNRLDITHFFRDRRVLQAMEAVAREMAEEISNEIRDFEASFVDK
jgi:hypothetical protein